MKIIILSVIFYLISISINAQDILTKKDGSQLNGKVTEQQDGYVKVQNGNDVEYVSKGEVKNIHYGTTSEAGSSVNQQEINPENKNSQKNEDSPCKKNNTGNFCLNNTSGVPIKVTLNYKAGVNPSQPDNWQTVTIDAGSSSCFYDLPAGSHSFNANRNTDQFGTVKAGSFFQGQINVVACEERNKDIK